MLTINGAKVTDQQQGTALACVDMESHRVLQPCRTYGVRVPVASCLPYAPEAQGSLPQRGTTVHAPFTYQPREYRPLHAVAPQALAKAAVGDVVYYILRGEELVTVTTHKPEAATRLGVTIKNLTDDQQVLTTYCLLLTMTRQASLTTYYCNSLTTYHLLCRPCRRRRARRRSGRRRGWRRRRQGRQRQRRWRRRRGRT